MNKKRLIILIVLVPIALILLLHLLLTAFIFFSCPNEILKAGIGNGLVHCNPKTQDSNKICIDNNQCEGYCLAQSNSKEGRCSATKYPNSCFTYLKNGKANEICID